MSRGSCPRSRADAEGPAAQLPAVAMRRIRNPWHRRHEPRERSTWRRARVEDDADPSRRETRSPLVRLRRGTHAVVRWSEDLGGRTKRIPKITRVSTNWEQKGETAHEHPYRPGAEAVEARGHRTPTVRYGGVPAPWAADGPERGSKDLRPATAAFEWRDAHSVGSTGRLARSRGQPSFSGGAILCDGDRGAGRSPPCGACGRGWHRAAGWATSAHTRGWSRRRQRIKGGEYGFPAHAGIHPGRT